jgi:hypothetical protein
MAITRNPNDPQGLMAALGPSAVGMGSSEENLIGDFEEGTKKPAKTALQKEFERIVNDRQKFVKEFSEKTGLDKKEIYNLLNVITKKVEGMKKNLVVKMMQEISPVIRKDLLDIIKLSETGKVQDEQKAIQKIDDIQKKFNLDLKQFNKQLGSNFDKLLDAVDRMKEDTERRIQAGKEEQARQLEKGRATSVNEQGTLKFLSPQEKRQVALKTQNLERQIKKDEKDLNEMLKQKGTGKEGKYTSNELKERETIRARISSSTEELKGYKEQIGEAKPSGIGQALEGFFRGERGPQFIQQFMASFAVFTDGIIFIVKSVPKIVSGIKYISEEIIDFLPKMKEGFSNALAKFKNFISSFSKQLGPLLDNIKKIGESIFEGIQNFLGFGKTEGGGRKSNISQVSKSPNQSSLIQGAGKSVKSSGAGSTVTKGVSKIGMAGLAAGGIGAGGTAAAGGAVAAGGAAAAGGTAAAAGGTVAAGGAAAAGAGGAAILPILGIVALIGGLVWGLSKIFGGDNQSPEEAKKNLLEGDYDALGNYTGGTNDSKIKGSTEQSLKQQNLIEQSQKGTLPKEKGLAKESEKYVGNEDNNNIRNIINQNNMPTMINNADNKTIMATSFINNEPTFNIINTNKVV